MDLVGGRRREKLEQKRYADTQMLQSNTGGVERDSVINGEDRKERTMLEDRDGDTESPTLRKTEVETTRDTKRRRLSNKGIDMHRERELAKLVGVSLFGWLVGFLTSWSTTGLYRGRAPRQGV